MAPATRRLQREKGTPLYRDYHALGTRRPLPMRKSRRSGSLSMYPLPPPPPPPPPPPSHFSDTSRRTATTSRSHTRTSLVCGSRAKTRARPRSPGRRSSSTVTDGRCCTRWVAMRVGWSRGQGPRRRWQHNHRGLARKYSFDRRYPVQGPGCKMCRLSMPSRLKPSPPGHQHAPANRARAGTFLS